MVVSNSLIQGTQSQDYIWLRWCGTIHQFDTKMKAYLPNKTKKKNLKLTIPKI